MKVLLMVPLRSLVNEPPAIPDLGLGYLATVLDRAGHLVRILGWNMNPSIEAFKSHLKEYQPQVVGIKVFTKDVLAAMKTISIIKSVDPCITVVIGGPHPSADNPERIMEDFPCDFAFQGEAEIGLPRLLEVLSSSKLNKDVLGSGSGDFKNISGLVWREDGKTLSNPRVFETDLDKLGIPLWELMKPKDYLSPSIQGGQGHLAPVIFTRGCPGNCTFCSAYHVNGKRVRFRSPQDFVNEIELLYQDYEVRQFMITDNCFTHNKELLKEVCNLLIAENLNIVFDCASYQNLNNLDQETLSLLKRAGCTMIIMGIECGSERIREFLKKSGTLGYIKEKESLIIKYGIAVRAYFMMGFPYEKVQDINETIKFARSLKTKHVHFEICFPLPGSEIYHYLKEKYNFERLDWANFDVYSSPYPVGEVPTKKLLQIMKRIQLAESLKSGNIRQTARGIYRFFKKP